MAKKPAQPNDVEGIKDWIDEFFSDTSRTQQQTLDGLEEIEAHVQMHIEAIKDDLKDHR